MAQPFDLAAPQAGYAEPVRSTPVSAATIGSRFLGLWVDGFVGAVFSVPAFVLASKGERLFGTCTDAVGVVSRCNELTRDSMLRVLIASCVGSILFFTMNAVLTWRRGQTVGHRIVGVRLVSARTGGSIGLLRSLGRVTIGRLVNGVLFPLYLIVLFSKDRRTLADWLFDTRAIVA